MSTILGFAEAPNEEFNSDAYPSKIGGLPKWLPGHPPLSPDHVRCVRCGGFMKFLLQLYAPEDELSHAFHRMLYVFVCPSNKCYHGASTTDCIKIFRAQSAEVEDEGATAPHSDIVCGLAASKSSDQCQDDTQCSSKHQVSAGVHGGISVSDGAQSSPSMGYPEYEILSEPENYAEKKQTELGAMDDTVISTLLSNTSVDDAEEGDDVDEDSHVDVDAAFLKFQKRVRHDPDQIVRYLRSDGSSESPLWVNSCGEATEDAIPRCDCCGERRTAEFQIMPQIISLLELDHSDADALDFGTIVVYTCDKSCGFAGHFASEIGWRQDFSADSMATGR